MGIVDDASYAPGSETVPDSAIAAFVAWSR